MNNKSQILEKGINWGVMLLAFLLPLFFLPVTLNFYDFNKNILLIFLTGLLLLAWVGKMLLEKKVILKRTPFDLPVMALAAAYLLSCLFTSPNRFLSLTSPGATGTVLALTFLFFIITNNFKKETLSRLKTTLIISAALTSLLAIYQFIGVAEVLTDTPWLAAKSFTPLGDLVSLAIFLALVLPLGVEKNLQAKKEAFLSSLFPFLATFLILSGLFLSLYQMATDAKPIFLPFKTGWVISIETLKNSPLFGVSPANFVSAFTRFKPIEFNNTDFWGFRFGISSNFVFQVITVTGFLGLLALILLFWQVKRVFPLASKIPWQKSLLASLVLAFLFLLLLPLNFILLYFTFLLLALVGLSLPGRQYQEESRILPGVFLVISLPLVLTSFYFMGKVFLADYYFKASIDALNANRGGEAYNWQIRAITANPYNDSYRSVYAETNFALANSMAIQEELSDQEREQITLLIEQAIREAKSAVALNPQNVANWEGLANLYRALINFAPGAEDWAISTFQNAVSLDPFNPSLRVDLGSIYYSLQRWDQAQRQFEIAVELKPNFANARYNLAAVLREKGEFAQAAQQMEIVLSLVPVDSGDFQIASNELEELKKKLGEEAIEEVEKAPESLRTPEPLPTGIKPPLELPKEVAPEVTPAPEPTPTPTPDTSGFNP